MELSKLSLQNQLKKKEKLLEIKVIDKDAKKVTYVCEFL